MDTTRREQGRNKVGGDFLKVNNVYNMDCIEGMKKIKDNTIDLTVTSPPYDNLRTYKGYSFDFKNIASQLYRITKKGGVVVWVVGDATINGSETGTSFKQALYFKKIGFNIYDTMIYKKKNIPVPSSNRYHQCFEYMFVFSNGKPNTFNSIEDRLNRTAGSVEKRKFRQKDGEIKKDDTKRKTKVFGMRTNIWEYVPGSFHSGKDNLVRNHPAVFPEKLVEDHIKSWSNRKDIVLDPMCGSGTTLVVANYLDRKYIGFDISKEYVNLSKRRLKSRPTINKWM